MMQSHQADVVQRYRPLAEMVPAHWQSGTLDVEDGTRMHYTRTGGAKPAVLLLHGVQAHGLTWLRTAQALEADYDVVMPDVRGHGESGRAITELSSAVLVQDMIALLKTLGLEQPFVVGHSMGAEIAGRLAAAHPVRAIVLVDPALQNFAAALPTNTDEPPLWMLPIIETMQALRTQQHAERMVTGLRLLPPGTPVWAEADYVGFVDAHAYVDPAIYRSIANIGYLVESPDVIADIACAMLLLTARPMMPGMSIEPGVAVFKQHWRNGEHIHFEDSGHFIMFDQFTRFMDALTGFLRTH